MKLDFLPLFRLSSKWEILKHKSRYRCCVLLKDFCFTFFTIEIILITTIKNDALCLLSAGKTQAVMLQDSCIKPCKGVSKHDFKSSYVEGHKFRFVPLFRLWLLYFIRLPIHLEPHWTSNLFYVSQYTAITLLWPSGPGWILMNQADSLKMKGSISHYQITCHPVLLFKTKKKVTELFVWMNYQTI